MDFSKEIINIYIIISAEQSNILFYIFYFVAFGDKRRCKSKQKYMSKTGQ